MGDVVLGDTDAGRGEEYAEEIGFMLGGITGGGDRVEVGEYVSVPHRFRVDEVILPTAHRIADEEVHGPGLHGF